MVSDVTGRFKPQLISSLEDQLRSVREELSEIKLLIDGSVMIYDAFVVRNIMNPEEEKFFGPGAVEVKIPYGGFTENLFARPAVTPLSGELIIPSVNTWVKIITGKIDKNDVFYLGYSHLCFRDHAFQNGFLHTIHTGYIKEGGDYFGGKKSVVTRRDPDRKRIYSSSGFHVHESFDITDNDQSGKHAIRVRNNSELYITSGNNGKIIIENASEDTDATGSGSYILINSGLTGKTPSGTAGETEIFSKNKLNIVTGNEFSMDADSGGTINIKGKKLSIKIGETEVIIESDGKVSIKAGGKIKVEANGDIEMKSGSFSMKAESSGKITFNNGAGKVLTTLSDPVVDTITGTPSTGSEYMKLN